MMNYGCWVAFNVPDPGPCSGRLVRAHLIAKQTVRREAKDADLWDPRIIVPICGGPTGCSGHHGALDVARTLRIPREALPPSVEEFAAEHGLLWWVERTYGPKEMAK